MTTINTRDFRFLSGSVKGAPIIIEAFGALGTTATAIHAPTNDATVQDFVRVDLHNNDLENPVDVAVQVNPADTSSDARELSSVLWRIGPGKTETVLDYVNIAGGGGIGIGIEAHVINAADTEKIVAYGGYIRVHQAGS